VNRWLETLTDPFLLRRAEAKAKAYGDAQRARIVELHRAAKTRARAAAELRSEAEAPAAIALLREAFQLSANMSLIGRGEHAADAPLLPLPDAWQAVTASHPAHAALTPLLGNGSVLAPDALERGELERSRSLLESLVQLLLREAEPRSPRAIRVQRVVRVVLVALAFVALLVGLVIWIARPPNVARGSKVTASSRYPGSPDPANLVDGNTTAAYGVHTNPEDAPWVEVDLGQVRALKRIVVYHRTDGYEKESLPLTLEASEDHGTWNRVATRRDPFTGEKPWIEKLTGQPARWLRFTLGKNGYISLGEVEAYEK
jgi:hypothetical protein